MTVSAASTARRINRGIVIRVSLRYGGASLPIILPVNTPLISAVSDTRHAEALAVTCGGSVLVDEFGPQIHITSAGADVQSVLNGWVAPVADLAVLSVEGDDAVRFLHSQLTNDIETLNEERWVLAGYCSAKGRLLTSLMCWRTQAGVRLIIPQPFVPGLKKRLSMFVLRAKVRIIDETEHWCLFGLGGRGAADMVKALGGHWPAPKAVDQSGPLVLLGCVPIPAADLSSSEDAASVARALLLVPTPDGATVWSTLTSGLTGWSSTLALGRYAGRSTASGCCRSGTVRSANGQPRSGRRCQLQKGLLPGAGSRRAQSLPGEAQAQDVLGACSWPRPRGRLRRVGAVGN